MIQFSINRTLFIQALNATKRGISSKNAIPVLSTIKIDVSSSDITLTGSNGQISIENTIPVSNENAGLLITSQGLFFWKQISLSILFLVCQMLVWILKKLNNIKLF